jgi:hypothetical protein
MVDCYEGLLVDLLKGRSGAAVKATLRRKTAIQSAGSIHRRRDSSKARCAREGNTR